MKDQVLHQCSKNGGGFQVVEVSFGDLISRFILVEFWCGGYEISANSETYREIVDLFIKYMVQDGCDYDETTKNITGRC